MTSDQLKELMILLREISAGLSAIEQELRRLNRQISQMRFPTPREER